MPPKIKLKVGQQAAELPTPSKKITIHVGSGRGASTEALTPLTRESVDTPSVNETTTAPTQTTAVSVDDRRSVSAAVASPGQSALLAQKSEEATATASPAVRPMSSASGQLTPVVQPAPPAAPAPPPAPVIPMEEKHPRLSGKGKALSFRVVHLLHCLTISQVLEMLSSPTYASLRHTLPTSPIDL